MSEAIYVGNGKKHVKFDNCLTFGFSKENLAVLTNHLNEKGWVNVIISPTKDDPERYYAKIDDWKPKDK